MHFGSSKLAGTRLDEKNRLSSCVKLLLLWMAASDGDVDESELDFAASQFPEGAGTIPTGDLLSAIRQNDLGSLEMALRILAHESRELRTAFLDLAVTMSMADREMAIPENHILRFYADALHLGIPLLEKRFRAICGTELAEPGNPADPDWWARVGGNDRRAATSAEEAPDVPVSATPSRPRMTLEDARALLGVEREASAGDIERAYRHLADIFRVDRVEAMGEAAVALAKDRSVKIEQAYTLLRG